MRGPEHAVDQLLIDIAFILLNGQQVRFDVGQMLATLGQLILHQFVIRDRPVHFASTSHWDTEKCW